MDSKLKTIVSKYEEVKQINDNYIVCFNEVKTSHNNLKNNVKNNIKNNIKNKNKIKPPDNIELKKKYKEVKMLNDKFIVCFKKIKDQHDNAINEINNNALATSDDAIKDLNLGLDYLKANDNLKTLYNAYKDLLKDVIDNRKMMYYYATISEPLFSQDELNKMIKEQNNIMGNVKFLMSNLPNKNNRI